MKNLELRSSVIKSGLLLGLCIFFIYAFAADGSGGVGGTISSLFSGITFLIGLSIALIVSVVVMFGVYFGILYLYDADVSRKTYGEFLELLNKNRGLLPISGQCCTSKTTETPSASAITVDDLKPLMATQELITAQLASLDSTVGSLQQGLSSLNNSVSTSDASITELSEQSAKLETELENKAAASAIDDSAKKLAADIAAVKGSIAPLTDKLAGLEETVSGLDSSDDGDEGLAKMDKALTILQSDLETIKKSIAETTVVPAAPASTDSEDAEEHRMLSYFTKAKDKDQFIASVSDAVSKDMTYAQAGDFLEGALSKAACQIMSEHPSLTKDYIKAVRQKD